jgi:hypothetical protein
MAEWDATVFVWRLVPKFRWHLLSSFSMYKSTSPPWRWRQRFHSKTFVCAWKTRLRYILEDHYLSTQARARPQDSRQSCTECHGQAFLRALWFSPVAIHLYFLFVVIYHRCSETRGGHDSLYCSYSKYSCNTKHRRHLYGSKNSIQAHRESNEAKFKVQQLRVCNTFSVLLFKDWNILNVLNFQNYSFAPRTIWV